MPKIGTALTQIMIEKNMTAPKLAAKIGVERQSVNRWMKNGTIKDDLLEKVATALHVTLPELTKSVKAPFRNRSSVPYYDIDVAASNIEMFDDNKELPTLSISIPGFEDCSFAVPVWGDSMYP